MQTFVLCFKMSPRLLVRARKSVFNCRMASFLFVHLNLLKLALRPDLELSTRKKSSNLLSIRCTDSSLVRAKCEFWLEGI